MADKPPPKLSEAPTGPAPPVSPVVDPHQRELDSLKRSIQQVEGQRIQIEKERDELASKVASLEARIAAQERAQQAQATAGKAVGNVVGKTALTFAMGLRVRRAFERLFQAMRDGNPFPVQEMADLGAAIIRRMVFTQLLSTFIAVLPLLLLIQQNYLLSTSNQREAQHARVARSTQLVELLYEETCTSRGACTANAPPRLRTEAARAYVELEQDLESKHIDLSKAHMEGVVLLKVDLREVDFREATFDEASLRQSDLSGADLRYTSFVDADLTNADLVDARIIRADFHRADLSGVRFGDTSVAEARFDGASLQSADLSDASQLRNASFDGAGYNKQTRFPKGFDPKKAGMVLKEHPRATSGG